MSEGAARRAIASRPGRWLPLQALTAGLALALAMIGYQIDGTRPWWDDLYISVALFAGDTTTLGDEHALVAVARWLALAVTVSAVVAVALAVVRRRAGGIVSRSLARDHVVVLGRDRTAARVAAGMADRGRRVLLVSDAPDAEDASRRGVAVVAGHPGTARHLRAARIERAGVVVAVMDDDAETTHIALSAAPLATRARVLGLMRDPVARSHLQRRILDAGRRPVELVALPEAAAHEALTMLAPLGTGGRTAVLGEGPVAETLALAVARRADAGEGGHRPTLLASAATAARLARIPWVAERVAIVPVEGDAPQAGAGLKAAGVEGRAYVCPPATLGEVLALADAAGRQWRWLLLLDDPSEEVARAAVRTLDAMGVAQIAVADVHPGALAADILSYGMLEEIARAKHEQYLRDHVRTGTGSAEASRPWDELSPELRRANLSFAEGVLAHLARTGRRLVLDQDAGPPEDAPPIFAEDEIEDLARAEHDRWMTDKAASGWTYGVPRDDVRLHHPMMVPWEDLDEPTRDKDRDPMRELGRILAEAGLRTERIAPDGG